MHELKFRVGERVRVVQNKYELSHRMEIGRVYVIKVACLESRKGDRPCDYQEYFLDGGGWVAEDEIEAA